MKYKIFLRTAIILCVISALIYLSSCSVARDGAIINAEQAYSSGEFKKVLTDLGNAESITDFTEKQKPYITFLKASSLDGMGDEALAKGMYQYLVDKYPSSEYAASTQSALLCRVIVPI